MNWRLVRNLVGEPEIDERDDEDLSLGYSLLREMAGEYGLNEIAPGVYLGENEHTVRHLPVEGRTVKVLHEDGFWWWHLIHCGPEAPFPAREDFSPSNQPTSSDRSSIGKHRDA